MIKFYVRFFDGVTSGFTEQDFFVHFFLILKLNLVLCCFLYVNQKLIKCVKSHSWLIFVLHLALYSICMYVLLKLCQGTF